MRALIIANPRATSASERTREKVTALLAQTLEVRLALTRERGHAIALAEYAAKEKVDLVVAIGGDGTINEVINGLLHDGPNPAGPALGVVPGGHANVMAHALHLPTDPIKATRRIIELIHRDLPTIGLGMADDRWFAFNAGVGVDAETVAAVEEMRDRGLPSSKAAYTAGLVKAWVASGRRGHQIIADAIDAQGRTTEADGLASLIVQNARPWTMLGQLPVEASPTADLSKGLDIVALRSLSTPVAVRTATSMLSGRGLSDGDDAVVLPDVAEVTVTGSSALPLQVDGDLIGDVTQVTFRSVPRALRVVADLSDQAGGGTGASESDAGRTPPA